MLTENQRGVLVSMYTGEWMRPMDMGGRDGSHHSATLAALVRKGLVERKVRWRGVRGSYLYRITEAGSAANQQVRCRCGGGSYEVRERPFLVHPECPVHASNQQVPGGAS